MPLDEEQGDDYLRRIATFVRNNEKGLAEAAAVISPRRRPSTAAQRNNASYAAALNPFSWSLSAPTPVKPIILSLDTHHLFYILMRFEALGFDIGSLDVQIESPSRPLSYIDVAPHSDNSDALSLASFRSSISAMSNLSLGVGWWGRPEPPTIDAELKFLYSAFTKLPGLSLTGPGKSVVAELANDPPSTNAIPLEVFKNLSSLECCDIDPRALLGWDKLADNLRVLKIKRSGMEDISDVFIGAVVDDQARREGSTSRKRRRRIMRMSSTGFQSSPLPESIPEDSSTEENEDEPTPIAESSSPIPSLELPAYKWSRLRQLSLSDNSLTFLPSSPLPYLTAVTHLDLSSNLLVSVPPGLSAMYNLVSLNLSDNMIDSVLGIYTNLGQVLSLNLSYNRLESICGLERLTALERVDLRHNNIEESAEISRLATIPNIAHVSVEGNPFTEIEEFYRVSCFDYFWKEGKSILLDGSPPGFYEKSKLTMAPSEQMSSSRPVSVAHSPPTVAVGGHPHPHPHSSPQLKAAGDSSNDTSPALGIGVSKARRKKVKRIVDLDGEHHSDDASAAGHSRSRSEGGPSRLKAQVVQESPPPPPLVSTIAAVPSSSNGRNSPRRTLESSAPPPTARRSRHSRYQTEYQLPSASASSSSPPLSPLPTSPSAPPHTSMLPPISTSTRRSATLSGRSNARRTRVSASVFEAPGTEGHEDDRTKEMEADGEAFRRKIEALKQDMGDGWLKVFSQSQMSRA